MRSFSSSPAGRTELPIWRVLRWLGLARRKFDRWSRRLGTPNQHNGRIPRDFWLEDWEKAAIIAFHHQSNGKIERWFKTLKGKYIRVTTSLAVKDTRRLAAEFVDDYNTVRLHSAIVYITPADKLAGRAEAIWAARREKLARADARRRANSEEKEFARS